MSAMVIAASRAAAQISAARLDALEAHAAAALEADRRIARDTLAGAAPAPYSRLAATLADFLAAADSYEKAARREADLREA
jgi:hypothetical protein